MAASAMDKVRAKLAAAGKIGPAEVPTQATETAQPAASGKAPVIRLPQAIAQQADAQAQATKAQAMQAAQERLKNECAISQYGDFIVLAEVGRRIEVVHIDGEPGEDYIRHVVQTAVGKMPPKSEIENLRAGMRTAARTASRRKSVYQRIAYHAGARWVDLGDADGTCIRVTADGWELVHNTEVAFIRGRGYGELPAPVGASSSRAAFKLVFDWLVSLGIKKSRAPLVLVALLAWLRTGNAYPLLLFFGPPGAGKTVAARLVMLLIDPTDSTKLPNVQTDTEHIAAAAQHRHVLTFDNGSKLSAKEQDLFCTCATGGEIVTRRLYSNGDIATLPIHRPVLMTAVQPVVTRADLVSRTIAIEFAAREARRKEGDILAEFLDLRPALLGALCDLLVEGEGA